MIKNLNQLKQELKFLPQLEIVGHCRKECIGEIRQVTKVTTRSFTSRRIQPEGKNLTLWWRAASFWSFENGVCSTYDSSTAHTEEHLVTAFRVLNKKEAA